MALRKTIGRCVRAVRHLGRRERITVGFVSDAFDVWIIIGEREIDVNLKLR